MNASCRYVAAVLCLVFSTSCSDARRESLNRFATDYVAYRTALYDSEIGMYAILLDQAQRGDAREVSSYRMAFVKALDSKASKQERAYAATQSLAFYQRGSVGAMQTFENRNDIVDEKSLALVEAAHSMRNAAYRSQVIEIADSARKIQHTLVAIRENYFLIYDLQTLVLKAIARENGDLNKNFDIMREKSSELQRLTSESDSLLTEEQDGVRRLQEQYAALKGSAGISIDYIEPPAESSNHASH